MTDNPASVVTERRVILTDSAGDSLTLLPRVPESDSDETETWTFGGVWASPEALRAFTEQILAVLDGDA